MYLSDRDILGAVQAEKLTLSDFDVARLNPASYDILLGNKFLIAERHQSASIDPVNKILPEYQEVIIWDDEHFILHPGSNVLGHSRDYFGSKEYLIQLSGKSSLARIGLVIHNTAGIINPGHFLNIVFELSNFNNLPIILRPGMRIGQLTFSQITSSPDKWYDVTGRYHTENWKAYVPEKTV
ncbi:MAG: hypothetical protein ACD_71C00084G0002 [uncultured bacterium (gcode 4)]|uniref:Deoxycytidine triphosphate deaminase n=1 Tax=uncultured bacterium (gcode 4) TaxID=1234023 RepID=K2A3I1_9BACT|nr:MAG: hypothetical protein ACD_71C00084G0002 [uncultured bacterium (gcode 4)]